MRRQPSFFKLGDTIICWKQLSHFQMAWNIKEKSIGIQLPASEANDDFSLAGCSFLLYSIILLYQKFLMFIQIMSMEIENSKALIILLVMSQCCFWFGIPNDSLFIVSRPKFMDWIVNAIIWSAVVSRPAFHRQILKPISLKLEAEYFSQQSPWFFLKSSS